MVRGARASTSPAAPFLTPLGLAATGAASLLCTQIVPNVHEFPGHIACSSKTNSEIVVPMVKANGVRLSNRVRSCPKP